jgi:hypothetical protein
LTGQLDRSVRGGPHQRDLRGAPAPLTRRDLPDHQTPINGGLLHARYAWLDRRAANY